MDNHRPAAVLFDASYVTAAGVETEKFKSYSNDLVWATRRSGGLVICDETGPGGLGRLGRDSFWSFMTVHSCPDIVTVRKTGLIDFTSLLLIRSFQIGPALGNGVCPISAVVCKSDIADSLKSGYFSTYGGNPVACATACAVLDAIRSESMEASASSVGSEIKDLIDGIRVCST